MKYIITLIILLLTTPTVFAEPWVCFDSATKKVKRTVTGDGFKLGICGLNNSNIKSNCILATKDEYRKSKNLYVKVDVTATPRVVDLTAQEISDIETAQAQSITDAETSRKNRLDISGRELARALIDLGIVTGPILKAELNN